MKQGDTVPVTIAGQVVAQATVREVGEGEVTLVVPATLVRMATRTEIAYEAPKEPETERVIVGVDTPVVDDATVVTQSGGDTPQVEMPPVTDPGETAQQPVTQAPPVEAQEPVNPVVSDNDQG